MKHFVLDDQKFRRSIRDYLVLIVSGYPDRAAHKLVCDKYRLNQAQRTALYRGIHHPSRARARKQRLASVEKHVPLIIDLCNAVYTVANYLLGRAIFISNDGFLRDAGEAYKNGAADRVVEKALVEILMMLPSHSLAQPILHVDESRAIDTLSEQGIRKACDNAGIECCIVFSRSADSELKKAKTGLVATSDSEILDACMNSRGVFFTDLPFQVLKGRYRAKPISLSGMIPLFFTYPRFFLAR